MSMTPLVPQEEQNAENIWTLWWHALDRWILVSIILLIVIGTWLVMAVSPAVAVKHHWTPLVLLKKHLLFVMAGLGILLYTSFMRKEKILQMTCGVGAATWVALWAVLIVGTEIKGAKRWLHLAGLSLQPAEFIKPVFVVLSSYLLAQLSEKNQRFLKVMGLFALVSAPLLLQPDLGTFVLLASMALCQCFIAGLSWKWVAGAITTGILGLGAILVCFSHAAKRLQNFFSATGQDPFGRQYQILQSLKSFSSGGLLGKGPGAGEILDHLPDGHADFIFAVAGEELGLLACLAILGLYGIIVVRSLQGAFREMNLMHSMCIASLTFLLSFQIFLNIACVLKLLPTKGMTLPLISYGGSSFLAVCWTLGLILCLTRRYRMLL